MFMVQVLLTSGKYTFYRQSKIPEALIIKTKGGSMGQQYYSWAMPLNFAAASHIGKLKGNYEEKEQQISPNTSSRAKVCEELGY